jgi:hypothetical protein
LTPCILQRLEIVLIDARHDIDLLVVDRLRWCLPLKLQKFLPEVGGRLRPLLKLDVLRVHGVLEVDDPMGTDIHLLTSDVEQLTHVVQPMLGHSKMMVSNLQLTVLL